MQANDNLVTNQYYGRHQFYRVVSVSASGKSAVIQRLLRDPRTTGTTFKDAAGRIRSNEIDVPFRKKIHSDGHIVIGDWQWAGVLTDDTELSPDYAW
jgi:hypothetical protein